MDVQVKNYTNLISISSILFDNLPLNLYKPIPSQQEPKTEQSAQEKHFPYYI
jgi:hypothetical protein